jgi:hypothetical protein
MPTPHYKSVAAVGSAIPLAIALVHSALVPSNGMEVKPPGDTVEAVVCADDIEDYVACHSEYPTGCNSNGRYDAYLNLYKNQVEFSVSQPNRWFTTLSQFAQLENDLPSDLSKNNQSSLLDQLRKLGEGEVVGAMGYMYSVKPEGPESSNCQLEPGDNNENVDFHIYMGFDSSLASKIRNKTLTPADRKQVNPNSVIIEMTPHYRATYHPEWTLDAVKSAAGQQIRVVGQLLVDNEHFVKSQDCGREDHTDKCWRATVWELHPVTRFEVCQSGDCSETSGNWQAIGTAQAAGSGSEP